MKKNKLAFAVSLFILLALPSISLYYSFKGSRLRKIAMAELRPKGILSDSVASHFSGQFDYRVLGAACSDSMLLGSLIDQFIQENIQFVLLGDSLFDLRFSPRIISQWNKLGSIVPLSKLRSINETEWKPCHFKLIDQQNQILNDYDLMDSLERRKMVEHIALLVTRK